MTTPVNIVGTDAKGAANAAHCIPSTTANGGSPNQAKEIVSDLDLQSMEDSPNGCAIGIDFGTSKCIVVGRHQNGQTTVGNPYSDRSIPAYFGLDSDNDLMCGTEVKEDYHLSINGFTFGVKRLLKGDRCCMTRYDEAVLRSLQSRNSEEFTLEKMPLALSERAAEGAGEELTQAIMDHLRGRVNEECDGLQIVEMPALLHEFRMKSEEMKKSMRSGTAVPFSFMGIKPGRDLRAPSRRMISLRAQRDFFGPLKWS